MVRVPEWHVRILWLRVDMLSFPHDFLIEWYRFCSQLREHLQDLIGPDVGHVTCRRHALVPEQSRFLYNVCEAEHIIKAPSLL